MKLCSDLARLIGSHKYLSNLAGLELYMYNTLAACRW